MANRPLVVDWNKVQAAKDDVMELEIVHRDGEEDMDSAYKFDELTEAQLDEKIDRIERTGLSLKLADGGEKLRISLEKLKAERDRRRRPQGQKFTDESKSLIIVQRPATADNPDNFWSRPSMPDYPRQTSVCSSLVAGQQRRLKPDNNNNTDNTANAFVGEMEYLSPTRYKNSMGNGQHCSHNRQTRNSKFSAGEFYSPCNYSIDEDKHRNFLSGSKKPKSARLSTFYGEDDICSGLAGKRSAALSLTPESSTKKTSSFTSTFSAKKVTFRISREDLAATGVDLQDHPLPATTLVVLDEEDEQAKQQQPRRMSGRRKKDVKIYYPSRDHPESVEICFSDMQCLAPCSYLSSPIMNFYIQYLQRPEFLSREQKNDYHFFNTFFYNKLEEALDSESRQENGSSFAKLRRWLKGVNIFEKSYIFLPIHACQHWSLAIISIPAKEDEAGPIVLHLDSLGLHVSGTIFENIRSYLRAEWEHLSQAHVPTQIPIAERIWKVLPNKIQNKQIQVPQQENEYDCGLFVLFFMERFIEEAPPRLRKSDLDRFGRKWFQPAEASHLRDSIKSLLQECFKDTNNSSPVVCEDLTEN